MIKISAAILAAMSLSACATIIDGTGQNVTISTTPPGARCDVSRKGAHLGTVASTPGSIRVDKSKDDIVVVCVKDRFVKTDTAHTSKFGGTTFGNILIGGLVGVVVDAASGANYTYDDKIDILLAPTEVPIPVSPQYEPTESPKPVS